MCFNRIQLWQRSQLINVFVRNNQNVSVDPANHKHAVLELVQNRQTDFERQK